MEVPRPRPGNWLVPLAQSHLQASPCPLLPNAFSSTLLQSWGTEVERAYGQAPGQTGGWAERGCVLSKLSCGTGPLQSKAGGRCGTSHPPAAWVCWQPFVAMPGSEQGSDPCKTLHLWGISVPGSWPPREGARAPGTLGRGLVTACGHVSQHPGNIQPP